MSLALTADIASAQGLDVIRGRVTNSEREPIAGAQVTVSATAGTVTRATRADDKGRFTVTFPGSDGNYFVTVMAVGYSPRRVEIRRVADEEILVADVSLARAATELDAVRVLTARNRASRTDAGIEISGTDQVIDLSALIAAQVGDLASIAATVPGVLFLAGSDGDPAGFSILGLGQDQNLTTLNGLSFNGSTIPADAQVTTSLTTSPYDVSRGGFSGGNLNVQTRSGTNFRIRTSSVNLDVPAMQWTDRVASSLGREYSKIQVGGLASGPLQYDRSFYSVGYQVSRQSRNLQTLLNTDPSGLQAAGIAADSVRRLLSIMNRLAVPATSHALDDRIAEQGAVLAQFNLAPRSSGSSAIYGLTLNGSWSHQTPATQLLGGTGNSEMPAHSGERTNWSAGVQAQHSDYFGIGVLSQTNVSLGQSEIVSSRFLDEPSASVLIGSTLSDGSNAVTSIAFGGNAGLGTSQRSTYVQASNQLSWFTENNKHRIKLSTEIRDARSAGDGAVNTLGSFTFNSLADLDANHAAAFTRTLKPRGLRESMISGALGLGDWYHWTNNLQLQYGVRFDGNFFPERPEANAQLGAMFGVRNDFVPNDIYFSPRAGLAWTYGQVAQTGVPQGAIRPARGVVRTGIGVFQSQPNARLVAGAIENTGLSTAVQQVTCTGEAVPVPDWTAYRRDRRSVPARCSDGTTSSQFENAAPNVTLFSSHFVSPRSVRANASWSTTALGRFTTLLDATYSLNHNQSGWIDLNFEPVTRFTLSSEAGRPVYAPLTSIIPTSGQISLSQSRVSPFYNKVVEIGSDLRSVSKQFRATVAPLNARTASWWQIAYTYQDVREQTHGFNTNTAGNPLDVSWARGSYNARHQFQYWLFYNAGDFVRINLNGRFQSGLPYTPMVGGDVNGDGYANDRAFVINPASERDSTLARSMRSLLAAAPANVRQCLQRQLGTVAARNSCSTSWSASQNLAVSFNSVAFGLPPRAQLSFQVQNPLVAIDLLTHGSNRLHGWGQTTLPDQYLAYVRDFDPVSRRFVYDLNPRFGSTSMRVQALRAPLVLTSVVHIDVGPTNERELLVQQLNVGRTNDAVRLSASQFRSIYAVGGGLQNPIAMILRQSDTLQLSVRQSDSLAAMNRRYTVAIDSIWTPIDDYLAALPAKYDERAAFARYEAGRRATVDLLKTFVPCVNAIITSEQRRMLPATVKNHLDLRYLSAIRSGSLGGARR